MYAQINSIKFIKKNLMTKKKINNTNIYQDDFDLVNIIDILKSNISKIILITIFCLALGLSYFKLMPTVYSKKIEIYNTYNSLPNNFIYLNNFLNETFNSINPNESASQIGSEYVVNYDLLYKYFISEFKDLEEITSEANKFYDEKYTILDLKDSFIISISPISDLEFQTFISYNWKSFEDAEIIIKNTFKVILEKVSIRIINDINELILANKSYFDFKINEINQQINNRELFLAQENELILRYLESQKKIAENIGIDESQLEISNILNLELHDDVFAVPYYILGTKYLDAKISALKNTPSSVLNDLILKRLNNELSETSQKKTP